jgi:hypothetical protein
LAAVSDDPDLEYLMVDSCIVRVHQHGAAKKQQHEEAMDKSRGGLNMKIHAAVDALGNPIRLEHFQIELMATSIGRRRRRDFC